MPYVNEEDVKAIAQKNGDPEDTVRIMLHKFAEILNEEEYRGLVYFFKYLMAEKPNQSIIEYAKNTIQSVLNVNETMSIRRFFHDPLTVEEAKKKLRKGQHIAVNRSVFSHHGIFCGMDYDKLHGKKCD